MLPSDWIALALTPPRAHGGPCATGVLRASPADFVVDEHLGFEPSGAGQHVLLRVTKTQANTEWVQRQLAQHAGCKPMDVGFAGLKDRHAIATQYFTVPRGKRPVDAWLEVSGDGYRVVTASAHDRKLPRGALQGNSFAITLREIVGQRELIEQRIAAVAVQGVPNYFGAQRFGRDAGNLAAAMTGQIPRAREARGFALSSARSLLFNAVLAERVHEDSWNQLRVGDVANLDDSNSIFPVPELDAALLERVAQLDVHPTGPLWGEGDPLTSGSTRRLEEAVAERFPSVTRLLANDRMRASRRSLRLVVGDVSHAWLDDRTLRLQFRLTAGGFATAVLRELVTTERDESQGLVSNT